jgi:hypothetical protein
LITPFASFVLVASETSIAEDGLVVLWLGDGDGGACRERLAIWPGDRLRLIDRDAGAVLRQRVRPVG